MNTYQPKATRTSIFSSTTKKWEEEGLANRARTNPNQPQASSRSHQGRRCRLQSWDMPNAPKKILTNVDVFFSLRGQEMGERDLQMALLEMEEDASTYRHDKSPGQFNDSLPSSVSCIESDRTCRMIASNLENKEPFLIRVSSCLETR